MSTESNIVFDNADKLIDMQEIIDTSSIKYVKLETLPECLIGGIRQLKVTDSCMFIVNDVPNSLYYFNREGEFIRQIGKVGRGPGEYLKIGNVAVNENEHRVLLFDSEECKIIVYNYETGDYIRSFSNKYYPYGHFLNLNNSIYALENRFNNTGIPNNPTILILNDTGRIINSFIDRPELQNKKSIIPISANTCYFSENQKGNYYVPFGDDIIYNLTSNGKDNDSICCLHIKKGMYLMDVIQSAYNKNRKNRYGPVQELCVTNEGMFSCSVNFDDRPITLLGDLDNGIKVVGQMMGNTLDWPGLVIPLTTYGDYFVGKKNSVEMSLCNAAPLKIDENGNPVIVFFKYRTDFK